MINVTPYSNLRSIGPRSFVDAPIESFYIPNNLEDLDEPWCDRTHFLKTIIIANLIIKHQYKYSLINENLP